MRLELRDYQERGFQGLRSGFVAGHRAQILYLPTGGGKTETSIAMLAAAAEKGSRCAMVMDRIVLCDQTSKRLDRYRIPHGIMQSHHWRFRPHERIQVCTVQTLESRNSWPELDLLVWDEAHCWRDKTADFIRANPKMKVVGLTATPFTKGMGRLYSNVVSTATTHELVQAGSLVPLRVFQAKQIDMTGAKKSEGEWTTEAVAERGIKLTGDIVAEWVSKTHQVFGGPRKTIAFCSGVEHGNDLARKFQAAGYMFLPVSYKDSDEQKRQLFDEFAKPDSAVQGLIATDILTKGFDCVLEGTPVLTDRGEVPIERVQLSDKVWDGEEFVSHKGPIYKGVRDVITYAGITATADHLVYTASGWVPLGEVAAHGGSIARTGDGSIPIRLCASASEGGAVPLLAHQPQALRELWRKGDSVPLSVNLGSGDLGAAEPWGSGARDGVGSDLKLGSLRAGEPSLVESRDEQLTHTSPSAEPVVSSDSTASPACAVRGQDLTQPAVQGVEHCRNSRPLAPSIGQTKGRVWDLLACGPRNRFTAAGLLIHNCPDVMIGISARPFSKSFSAHVQQLGRVMRPCENKQFALWLDHAGNYLRFQESWEDVYLNGVSELDDSKEKTHPERTEREKKAACCPRCSSIFPPQNDMCLSCGYKRLRHNGVVMLPGELEEIKRRASLDEDERSMFWSELHTISAERGYKPGWAYFKFKEKFGSEPRKVKLVDGVVPRLETRKWVTSQARAFSRQSKKAA